jgi:hypothetical protein
MLVVTLAWRRRMPATGPADVAASEFDAISEA